MKVFYFEGGGTAAMSCYKMMSTLPQFSHADHVFVDQNPDVVDALKCTGFHAMGESLMWTRYGMENDSVLAPCSEFAHDKLGFTKYAFFGEKSNPPLYKNKTAQWLHMQDNLHSYPNLKLPQRFCTNTGVVIRPNSASGSKKLQILDSRDYIATERVVGGVELVIDFNVEEQTAYPRIVHQMVGGRDRLVTLLGFSSQLFRKSVVLALAVAKTFEFTGVGNLQVIYDSRKDEFWFLEIARRVSGQSAVTSIQANASEGLFSHLPRLIPEDISLCLNGAAVFPLR